MQSASSFLGKGVVAAVPQLIPARPRVVSIRAEAETPQVSRRGAAVGLFVALGALSRAPRSEAAFGEGANIFGKTTDTSGYIPYVGEGYAVLLPSKWNPSKEADFPGTVLRWEDNFDPLSHVVVTKTKSDKGSIEGYGSPESFLKSIGYMIGEQVFKGETLSEGGFLKDKVSSASLQDSQTVKDKNGHAYYKYTLLVRAADGNEGGRHVLLTATVGGGNLYVQKVQTGDKRWFKGADKQAMTVSDSFTIA